jgi:hypothetical protein
MEARLHPAEDIRVTKPATITGMWGEFYTEMTDEGHAILVRLRLAGVHPDWCVFWALYAFKDEKDKQDSLDPLERNGYGGWYNDPKHIHSVRQWLPQVLQDKYLC